MPLKLTAVFAMPVAFALAAADTSAHGAAMCSKIGFAPFQSFNQAHLIGTPAADTMLAGPGDVKYLVASGHSGGASSRTVYGQAVSVERIGGVAAGKAGSAKQVILVPWDYAANCRPTIWARSARWLPTGERGFFIGALRDSVHWVNGIPTLDVFTPEVWPYPQQAARMMRRPLVQPSFMLDIDEIFTLTSLLPDRRDLDSASVAAEPLFAWARANPDLLRRYPVFDALHTVRRTLMEARVKRIKPPIAGTYEFTFRLNDGPERTFFARTRPRANSSYSLVEPPPAADPTAVSMPDGYYVISTLATSADSLPASCHRNRDLYREGYLLLIVPADTNGERKEWQGKVEPRMLMVAFPEDSDLAAFARGDFERFSRQRTAKEPTETPARFSRTSGGNVIVEQRIVLDDGRTLSLRGKRISPITETCEW